MRWCSFPYTLICLFSLLFLAAKPAKSDCNASKLSDGKGLLDESRFSILLKSVNTNAKNLLLKTPTTVTRHDLNQLIKKARKNYFEGNYAVSLKNALLAEKIAQQQHNDTAVASAGNLIALQYIVRDKYAEAFPYLKNALSINRKYRRYNQLASNQLNLSMYYASKNALQRPSVMQIAAIS